MAPGGGLGPRDAACDPPSVASTAWLQHELEVGYNRAARLPARIHATGIVRPPDEISRRDILVPAGIDPITASAIAASVPDARLFASGRQFAAWLG